MRPLAAPVIVACLAAASSIAGLPPARAQSPQASAPTALDPMRPETTPTDAQLGVQIFPTAQFLRSYDAGRGQRFYIFGAAASFPEVVAYYRTILKQRGYNVFDTPPTHAFEVGRFRSETMSYPPGVTIKDFTSGGSTGYPNPRPAAQPARFATVIQIVPVPPQ